MRESQILDFCREVWQYEILSKLMTRMFMFAMFLSNILFNYFYFYYPICMKSRSEDISNQNQSKNLKKITEFFLTEAYI